MVCDFYLNSKQVLVILGVGRKTDLLGGVLWEFYFKPTERKKERKLPKPRNNQETSSEFESESEFSDSQCPGGASNSVVDFSEDKQHK